MLNFRELISSEKLVLVDFFATWCSPCQYMAPILKEVKDVIGNEITIIKIDIDKNATTANFYSIQSVPTLMLIRNGQILWRKSGVCSKNELISIINQHK